MILLHKQQRGSTLLVALVMLVLLTLIALSAMNATTTSIQVVGNAQFREEANTAAQQAIESIISSNFTASPAASSVAVTFGAANYTAQVETPTCTSSIGLTNADLNPAIAADAVCLGSGAASNTGIMGASGVLAPTAQSWCYKQQWDIRTTVADSNTGANTAVHQGVFIRVPAGTTCP
ncbi:MAG TPA: PilX N-terminal domain-containing pilus assembly protein [Gallionella sp.]|nr:PilX N-terminal domain-containing pilus assembly protein [Gallionella sp.]